jgi:hypothetical protein
MVCSQETLRAKLQEAERLAVWIKTLPKESEEGKDAIRRWAVVGDETQRLMIQVEEVLKPSQLVRLKAGINGIEAGQIDVWAKYRESEWRLPQLGAPGPSEEPPPVISMRDLLQ